MRKVWAAGAAIVMCLALGGLPALAQESSESPAPTMPTGEVVFTGTATCGFGSPEEWLTSDPMVTGPCSIDVQRSGGPNPPDRWVTTRSRGLRATGPARGCSSASAAIPSSQLHGARGHGGVRRLGRVGMGRHARRLADAGSVRPPRHHLRGFGTTAGVARALAGLAGAAGRVAPSRRLGCPRPVPRGAGLFASLHDLRSLNSSALRPVKHAEREATRRGPHPRPPGPRRATGETDPRQGPWPARRKGEP